MWKWRPPVVAAPAFSLVVPAGLLGGAGGRSGSGSPQWSLAGILLGGADLLGDSGLLRLGEGSCERLTVGDGICTG